MDEASLDALFRSGHADHVAGRLPQAEQAYRAVLAQQPGHVDALHFLGVIALQCGQTGAALDLIGKSVSIAPTFASLSNHGEGLRIAGRLDEAIDAFRASLKRNAQHPDALANLGVTLFQQKKLEEAEQSFRSAIALNAVHVGANAGLASLLGQAGRWSESAKTWEKLARATPRSDQFHRLHGDALARSGDHFGAISAYRKALEFKKDDPSVLSAMAASLAEVKQFAEATAMATRTLELAPERCESHQCVAYVQELAGRWEEALDTYRGAVRRFPDEPKLHGSIGRTLMQLSRPNEAAEAFESGRRLAPTDARFAGSLARLYQMQQRFQSSVEMARVAIGLASSEPEYHATLAFSLLSLGEYAEGFREYEWRWRATDFTTKPRDFTQPLWDGSDIAGRILLLHSEQGFGDILQFLRYVPLLLARGMSLIVEVPYKLAGLTRRLSPDIRVVVSGTVLPRFDLHVPMLSLPSLFGTTLKNLPAEVPYLSADALLIDQWKNRLTAMVGRRRIGLVWAGNKRPDPNRTIPLSMFSPLAEVHDIALVSLQVATDTGEVESSSVHFDLDVGQEIARSFDLTAAVLKNLDLLITIDTGIAHLAGGLGIPTWLLLPFTSDWRWLAERNVSPWYPTIKIFRQPTAGEWSSVIDRVADELRSGG